MDYIEMVNMRYNDMIIRKADMKSYIDMNRINSITRFFLVIAYQNKKELLYDNEIKRMLDKELLIAKKLATKGTNKINSLDEKIASRLLMISPQVFMYVMGFYNKLKSLRISKWGNVDEERFSFYNCSSV